MIEPTRTASSSPVPKGAPPHDTALDRIRLAAAVLLGLLLVPLMARYLAEIEWVRYTDNATTQALFPHATAVLVLFTAASMAVRRFAPRLAFGRRELLICYVSICIGSQLAGHDMMQVLFSSLGHVLHGATPENSYGEFFHPYLPHWAVPSEGPGLRLFFEGNSSLFEPGNWDSWRLPSLSWGAFTVVLCLVMFSVVNLLRRQWENERLNYPIAQVPLRLTRDAGQIFGSREFLIGMALGILPTLLNTIKHFHPAFPGLAVQVRNFMPREEPWTAMGPFPVCFHPFAFGLAYLVPVDLLFSCWFFYIFTCAVRIICAWIGHRLVGGFPYVEQQAVGAHLALALIVMLNARRHVRFIIREAVHPTETRGAEAWSYRGSLLIFVAGSASLIAFMNALGLGVGASVVWLVLFLLVVVAVTRLRAEYGLPTNELFRKGPESIMVSAVGSRAFSRQQQVALALLNWLTRTHRQFPMQVQTDMLEVAGRGGIGLSRFGWLVPALTLAGVVSAVWALLDVSMQVGVATSKVAGPALWAFGPEPWNMASAWITSPTRGDYRLVGGYAWGVFFCWLMYQIRLASANWPFHPGGYVMSCTFGLARLWVPLFLTWCFKATVLRYGGHRLYLRFLPLFLGMTAGEYTSAFIRTLIDIAWKLYLPRDSGIGNL